MCDRDLRSCVPAVCSPEGRGVEGRAAARRGGLLSQLFGMCAATDVGVAPDTTGLAAEWNGQRPWLTAGRRLSWTHSDEVFTLCAAAESAAPAMPATTPVLEDRLYFMVAKAAPPSEPGVHFFTTDNRLNYVPFCDDWGPFNLAMMHEFCDLLQALLLSPAHANRKLVYYTLLPPRGRTNAIYLLGAFLVLRLGAAPREVWAPFSSFRAGSSIENFRDATWVPSTFGLTLLDCFNGLAQAAEIGLYSPATFNKQEYLYYDQPINGDMHECVKGKFLAFRGPVEQPPTRISRSAKGALGVAAVSVAKHPSDYIEVFRAKNVRTIVRLNEAEYDSALFTSQGFEHVDLQFSDCSVPSDAVRGGMEGEGGAGRGREGQGGAGRGREGQGGWTRS